MLHWHVEQDDMGYRTCSCWGNSSAESSTQRPIRATPGATIRSSPPPGSERSSTPPSCSLRRDASSGFGMRAWLWRI